MFNFSGVLKAIESFAKIANGFAEAKKQESDGGEEVTVKEIVGVSALLAAAWVRNDDKPLKISMECIVDAYIDAGFVVTYNPENE